VDNLDQRGFVRPGTGATNCSIGAYEFSSPGIPCGSGACVFPQVCVAGQCATPTPTLMPTNTPTMTPRALACVVGTGTGASCTEAALTACLPGGGSVTFNCGGAATITVTSTQTISADTTIDGGSLITISGGGSVGVFSVNAGVYFTVQNLTIANGNSATYGGGIFNGAGTLTVTNSTFSGNSAGLQNNNTGGGGIYSGGPLTVTNSTFFGNTVPYGGGIYSTDTLAVTNSTFSGNDAGGGAGIYSAGTATVTNSTFSDNGSLYPGGLGGGIFNGAGPLTVTNSTFFGNTTGGIYSGGPLAVTNSTFFDNSGGYNITNSTSYGIANSGTLTITNTILAGGNNCAGSVTDGGHNIDDGTTCGFTGTGCASTSGSSFCNTNPLLDSAGLANNGGPTLTIAIEPNSPAINAGDESVCSTTTGTAPVDNLDQRGFVRPGTGATNCSIGAYEFSSPGIPCSGVCVFPLVCVAGQCATPTPTLMPTNTPTMTPTPTPTGGFAPPDKKTGGCEDTASQNLAKLVSCVTTCQVKQANKAVTGKSFDDETCEQGTGKPTSCRAAYDEASASLLAKGACPACLDAAAQGQLADAAISFGEQLNASLYCAGSVAFGGDDSGFVPPDKETAQCENAVAKNAAKLLACDGGCRKKKADADVRGKAFNLPACETGTLKPVSCAAAFTTQSTKLLGKNICPGCLGASGQAAVATAVQTFIDQAGGPIYCAGTVPISFWNMW